MPLATAIPATKLPAMERAFMPAEAAFAPRVCCLRAALWARAASRASWLALITSSVLAF